MSDVALDYKKRQAAYAAKNRRKAKALRRPDARAVADAYMAAVESDGMKRMMSAYISKLTPDADLDARSQDIILIVRNLVRLSLMGKGYDSDQITDKLANMAAEAPYPSSAKEITPTERQA